MKAQYAYDEGCLAVIGMAGRFPGAATLEQLWRNLLEERVSRKEVPQELLEKGVHAALRNDPDYVPFQYTLDGYDMFDAEFFEFSPREVGLMDPQHRLVLEYAMRAFENAGYVPRDSNGIKTGVYASSDRSGYLTANLYTHLLSGTLDVTEAFVGNDQDYLATRIAYKHNFTGPALTVLSACSSSLTSLHTAGLSLLAGECDRAVVVSATVMLPGNIGYLYMPGSMSSPDGLCRPYDADAGGTVFANGVVSVLLKRLPEAMADNDHIWAVIRATAANNDGSGKVGFVAPSAAGQAKAVRAALSLAGASPEDIVYVEGHGTGTAMGDPIEVSALLEGYAPGKASGVPKSSGPVVLGSLKGNIGHLDSTAGLGSFAKACLSLYHGVVPGTGNFKRLNPAFGDIAPFHVSASPVALQRRADTPLLAGVSAFGFGGTNVHAILQEAPEPAARELRNTPQLLLFSAPHRESLEVMQTDFQEYFKENPQLPLEDAAYTLAVGRRHFAARSMIVASGAAEAAFLLAGGVPVRTARQTGQPVAFLLPGQGNLHPGAASGYYEHDVLFREKLDGVAALIRKANGPDILDVLAQCRNDRRAAEPLLSATHIAQPLLFGLESAFAATLMERGIQPACMVGHSLGEYAAAVVAGVFSLEDAAGLVVKRGQLMQSAPTGKMLVVSLGAQRVREVLGDLFEHVEISVINSPANCVLTGAPEHLEACARAVEEHGQRASYLKTSHAFHSASMDGIMEPFAELLRRVPMREPSIPFVSNVTGEWADSGVAQPEYWVRHMRSPVQFAGCLAALKEKTGIAVEAGPGSVMRSLAMQQGSGGITVVPGLDALGYFVDFDDNDAAPAPRRSTLEVAGELWANGALIDWDAFYAGGQGRRCPLPGVALRYKRFWIEPDSADSIGKISGASLLPTEKYERICSSAYTAPTNDTERKLAEIWQNLLFVDSVGIHDDFLELGGNSIQMMQMIRLAAAQGMQFSSKDVFAGKTVAGLSQRLTLAAPRLEAAPGPVAPPSYMARWLMPGFEASCVYALYTCPGTFTRTDAEKLAQKLAARHDALRLRWDGTGMRLVNTAAVSWAENNVRDMQPLMETAKAHAKATGDTAEELAAALELSGEKAWTLAFLPADGSSPPLLFLALARAIGDRASLGTLTREILSFMQKGELPESAGSPWKLWAEALGGDAFAPRAQRLQGEWGKVFSQLQPDAFCTDAPRHDAQAAAAKQHTLSEAGLAALIEQASQACRVPARDVFSASVVHALTSGPKCPPVVRLWRKGREALFSSLAPESSVGSYAYELVLPLCSEAGAGSASGIPAKESIPHLKEALYALPDHGQAGWKGEYTDSGVSVSVQWLDEWEFTGTAGTPDAAAGSGLSPAPEGQGAVLRTGEWNSPEVLQNAGIAVAARPEGGTLHMRVTCGAAVDAEWCGGFVHRLRESVRAVAEEGANSSASSRYVPSDFYDSGVTRDDIAHIVHDIGSVKE